MSQGSAFPPAEGLRLPWSALPAAVRARIEDALGARVEAAETARGGFSPGLAARLRLQGGREVFAKAAGPRPNPDTPGMHRAEVAVLRALPPLPNVPRLLAALDLAGDPDPDAEGWVALVSAAADGRTPDLPWRPGDLDRVLAALPALWRALTPAPLRSPAVPRLRDLVARDLRGWHLLAGRAGLDAWSARHRGALVALEDAAPDAVDGDTLLHLDLRADNVLLGADRVWIVDWPHATVGAAWFDLACLAPSVAMQGGPRPAALFARLPTDLAPRPEALRAGVACLAGFFTERSLRPPPPGLPTVRAFQAAQAEVARAWLRESTGLD